jgi:hypothetical protein
MKPSTKPMSRGKPIKAGFKKRSTEKQGGTLSEEMQHKKALAQLGCAVCFKLHGPHEPAPVELHHLRADGWGKGGYKTLIPLCFLHHRGELGVHGLGTKGFVQYYGFTQQDLLDWSLDKINQM